jgi:hypothetical protein
MPRKMYFYVYFLVLIEMPDGLGAIVHAQFLV